MLYSTFKDSAIYKYEETFEVFTSYHITGKFLGKAGSFEDAKKLVTDYYAAIAEEVKNMKKPPVIVIG